MHTKQMITKQKTKEYMKIAAELGYTTDVVVAVMKAETENEISRILHTARINNSYGIYMCNTDAQERNYINGLLAKENK